MSEPTADELRGALVKALAALLRYGSPDSYFAVAVLADRPAGWFADDVGDTADMGRRHGAFARETLVDIGQNEAFASIYAEADALAEGEA